MIVFKKGDIFGADVEAVVNTVNCVGVMGRGIALQFKKKFPENFKAYVAECKKGKVVPGKMFVYSTQTLTFPRFIINFPTKRHWRAASQIKDIEAGLNDLVKVIQNNKIKSIALPPLGCGLGGLNWDEVRVEMQNILSQLTDVNIVVFEPDGAPDAKNIVKNRKVPKMTPGRAALVELIHRYLSGLLDPFITLLEIHKLMYFLQEAGENLRLSYKKAAYGPYAENLRHVLNEIEGYYVSGYADGGDAPDKQLQLLPGAYRDASKFLDDHQETKSHYDKVSNLVSGFETPFGLELLSTVHWILVKESPSSIEQIIDLTYEWSHRKKQFSQRQIKLAYQVLCEKGWANRI